MTTLRDVSRRSGYSVTTVSRALNGFSDVTEATRKHIETIARELNYRPNQVARKLVSGRSGMVGLVFAGPPAPFEHGHFFHIIAGCSREFSAQEMDFVLHIGSGEDDVLRTYSRLINRGTLDGFLVTAPDRRDARIALLLERDVPFVVHGRDPEQNGYPYFDADNRAIARAAAELLADLGHRRIALLNGPAARAYSGERLQGFRDALAARGLACEPQLVRHGDTSNAYGRVAAAELLALGQRPTALVCCNSLAASGALEAIRAAGLRVPEDLSIVAHDDVLPQAETSHLDPPLTVTRLPLEDSAGPLVNLLLRRLAGADIEDLQITVGAETIRRDSTAPPPAPGPVP